MMSSACQNRAKAEQAALDGGAKPFDCDLRHHHGQPDQSGGDVQSVAADKGKERGKKSTALWGRADGDHAGELVDLKIEERGAEHESDQGGQISRYRVVAAH